MFPEVSYSRWQAVVLLFTPTFSPPAPYGTGTTVIPEEATVSIPKVVLTRMAKLHPHSEAILKAFVPLFEAQEALADALPAPELPPLDQGAFALGKPWMPVQGGEIAVYLDDAFVEAASAAIGAAALQGFPDRKEEIRALSALLGTESSLCRELATLGFEGRQRKVSAWAKKRGQDSAIVALYARHLAAAAAKRVEKATRARVLPAWNREYCPICGSRPHGSFLRLKEGKRSLQCSLCRKEWAFSRTTCPACMQNDPKELTLFFHQDVRYERAEVCNKCGHYILSVDTRELSDDAPPELYLLCMAPLDLLMQEKGHIPVNAEE